MRPQALLFKALNPVMAALLQSPLHGIASANICILTYRGRRSGRTISTPLSFMREGTLVRLLSTHNTRWWKNFLFEEEHEAGDVEIEIARRTYHGKARTFADDGERYREGIRRFLTAVPRDAGVNRIRLDADRKPREEDIAKAAGHVVLVEVQLDDV